MKGHISCVFLECHFLCSLPQAAAARRGGRCMVGLGMESGHQGVLENNLLCSLPQAIWEG